MAIYTNVLGRVGKDAEIKSRQDGTKFVVFSLATDDGYGENKKTQWLSCAYGAKNCEKIAEYLKKGKQIFVGGTISASAYVSQKSGEAGVDLKLSVRSLEFAGEKEEKQEMPAGTPKTPADFKEEEAPF